MMALLIAGSSCCSWWTSCNQLTRSQLRNGLLISGVRFRQRSICVVPTNLVRLLTDVYDNAFRTDFVNLQNANSGEQKRSSFWAISPSHTGRRKYLRSLSRMQVSGEKSQITPEFLKTYIAKVVFVTLVIKAVQHVLESRGSGREHVNLVKERSSFMTDGLKGQTDAQLVDLQEIVNLSFRKRTMFGLDSEALRAWNMTSKDEVRENYSLQALTEGSSSPSTPIQYTEDPVRIQGGSDSFVVSALEGSESTLSTAGRRQDYFRRNDPYLRSVGKGLVLSDAISTGRSSRMVFVDFGRNKTPAIGRIERGGFTRMKAAGENSWGSVDDADSESRESWEENWKDRRGSQSRTGRRVSDATERTSLSGDTIYDQYGEVKITDAGPDGAMRSQRTYQLGERDESSRNAGNGEDVWFTSGEESSYQSDSDRRRYASQRRENVRGVNDERAGNSRSKLYGSDDRLGSDGGGDDESNEVWRSSYDRRPGTRADFTVEPGFAMPASREDDEFDTKEDDEEFLGSNRERVQGYNDRRFSWTDSQSSSRSADQTSDLKDDFSREDSSGAQTTPDSDKRNSQFGKLSSSQLEEFDRLVDEGEVLLEEGMKGLEGEIEVGIAERLLYEAASLFQKASEVDPWCVVGFGFWGNTLLVHGELKLLLSQELRSMLPSSKLNTGARTMSSRNREDEVEDLELALQGVCEECEDLLVDAGRKFKLALTLDRSDMRALYNWGLALCYRGQLIADEGGEKALEDADKVFLAAIDKFEAMLGLSQEYAPGALYNWGLAVRDRARLRPMGDEERVRLLQQARELFQDVVRLDPNNGQARGALTVIVAELEQLERYEEMQSEQEMRKKSRKRWWQ